MVLEKTLESPLDCKEIQAVHPKGNQSWVFIGRTDVEAETPILWPLDGKSWLIWKDPDAGKDWGQEEKGTTEDEMAGWHHWLNWRWVWVDSGSWWWTGKPGVLQFMGSQRVGHDWETELNWTELMSMLEGTEDNFSFLQSWLVHWQASICVELVHQFLNHLKMCYLFVFGCAGSLVCGRFPLVVVGGGYSLVVICRLLCLWLPGSRVWAQ